MSKPWFKRRVRSVCAMAAAVALSGCIVVPAYGPRYGYYHPHYYGY